MRANIVAKQLGEMIKGMFDIEVDDNTSQVKNYIIDFSCFQNVIWV